MPARAIENQAYLAGVNRVGKDGIGLDYSGESVLIDPRGEYIHEAALQNEEVSTQSFSWKELEDFRAKFPVMNDADDFQLDI